MAARSAEIRRAPTVSTITAAGCSLAHPAMGVTKDRELRDEHLLQVLAAEIDLDRDHSLALTVCTEP